MGRPITRPARFSRLVGDRLDDQASRRRAVQIVLVYALAAGIWILASDHLLQMVIGDAASLTLAQTLKGLSFILVTATLLYALIRHITLSARSETVLKQDQARLLAMLENMPVMVSARDKDGSGADHRV
jgi:PAS domain-containing protein